jgi:hypothetical protein
VILPFFFFFFAEGERSQMEDGLRRSKDPHHVHVQGQKSSGGGNKNGRIQMLFHIYLSPQHL